VSSKDSADYQLYKRLFISLEDIFHAQHFAAFIIKNNLHYLPWERRQPTILKQTAYTTSFVISYCRAFTESRGVPKIRWDLIRYTRKEKELHDKIMEQRKKMYAHSDGDQYDISIPGDSPFSLLHIPNFRLSKSETAQLQAMMSKVNKIWAKKKDELHAKISQSSST
jgi:hypothetical protein